MAIPHRRRSKSISSTSSATVSICARSYSSRPRACEGRGRTGTRSVAPLLVRHDLPETRGSLNLQAKPGAPYAARLRVTTPFGVGATLDLEVPASHWYGHALRVDRVVDRLEVQAPTPAVGCTKRERFG